MNTTMAKKKETNISEPVCFLILHYMNINLTKNTIDSILNLNNSDMCEIVIVDNGSSNGTGKELYNIYKNYPHIHILLSEKNLGFSQGNNLGYDYIISHFNPQFIIATNNDVEFRQKDFLNILMKAYLEEQFWVAGPDVYNPYFDFHSSPLSPQIRDEKKISEKISSYNLKSRKLEKNFSMECYKDYIFENIKTNIFFVMLFKLKRKLEGKNKKSKKMEGAVLQGSCLIFDKRFCSKYTELFLPITFMYGEEDILAYRCYKDNIKTLYYPELKVYHMHRGSTQIKRITYKEYREKTINRQNMVVQGLKCYIEYLKVAERKKHDEDK